tara:strand:- start:486 stop:1049 length:564 start_codon:yes stop_codon:yes gene_type:complete
MVRVRGQIDAPLVDIGAVKQDFWERRTIVLPSLARLHKTKGWRSWFSKAQTPKIVVRRLKSSQWEEIQTDFANERVEIAKSAAKIREIQEKANNLEVLSSDEKKFLVHVNHLAQPMVYAMISKMLEEPKMTFEEVVILMETLDDYDRNTLVALVNGMSSDKASALRALADERNVELQKIKQTMGVDA